MDPKPGNPRSGGDHDPGCHGHPGKRLPVDPQKRISLVLLGTHKNTGLAAGPALSLLGERTALPATVSTVFMIVYVVWLSIKQRTAI